MQKLWSRVLAGEANYPGAFSKRTVNLLADLDKRDAELFTRLCGFAWVIGDQIVPMVFDCQLERYNCAGLYFSSLSHLETLGLVQFNNIAGFRLTKRPKMIAVVYYQRPLELTFPKDLDNGLVVGKVLLTRAGHELARVCDCDPEDGFFDYVYDIWANQSLVPKREQGPTS